MSEPLHQEDREAILKYELIKQTTSHNLPKEFLKSIFNHARGRNREARKAIYKEEIMKLAYGESCPQKL